MPQKTGKDPHPWKLSVADKEALKLSLLDHVLDNGLRAADIVVDGFLLFQLLPYLQIFNTKWDEFISQEDLEQAQCYPDMLKQVKDQCKGNRQTLEKKLELRMQERSSDNRSKATQSKAKANLQDEIHGDHRAIRQSKASSSKKQK